MELSEKDITRFWTKVKIGAPDECWPWLRAKTKFGHGVFSVKHKWAAAHRVSFLIANGYLPDIAEKRIIMHDCEFAACQNPKHLLDGTIKQNGNYPGHIKKQKAKIGCWRGCYGADHGARWGKKHSEESKRRMSEKAGSRKLEENDVVKILRSTKTSSQLAEKFGVSPREIRLIKERRRWRHVSI